VAARCARPGQDVLKETFENANLPAEIEVYARRPSVAGAPRIRMSRDSVGFKHLPVKHLPVKHLPVQGLFKDLFKPVQAFALTQPVSGHIITSRAPDRLRRDKRLRRNVI